MQNVIIADDRPLWVREEDRIMVCMMHCSKFKRCASRMGADCKRLGGSEIPKINSGGSYDAKRKQ
ncbi:hypothetical protein CHH84_19905 [Bacillus licheniformis]|nr:hypothetical protein CHH84_19905 [Bacillus licheniformis]